VMTVSGAICVFGTTCGECAQIGWKGLTEVVSERAGAMQSPMRKQNFRTKIERCKQC
jgi:hypothetical protein